MSLGKRVRRIETSLTPKQAVLLWLKETRHLGLRGFVEDSLRKPRSEAPRARITEMVGNAAYESLCKRKMKPELAQQVAREARKETDFLILLVWVLPRDVEEESRLNAPYVLLLFEKFHSMLEEFVRCDRFKPKMWKMWRAVLMLRLETMCKLSQTVDRISETYFDSQPLVFPEQSSDLDRHIHYLEDLAKAYNSLHGSIPDWTPIEIDALASSIREDVLAEVDKRVVMAKSRSLNDFGESEAADKLMKPYELAMLNRLRPSKGQTEAKD